MLLNVLSSSLRAQPNKYWAQPNHFVIIGVGTTVGLSNVLTFPHMVIKNGGGSFVCTCLLLIYFVGIPLGVLETSIGQWSHRGIIKAWDKVAPIFKGIGYGCTLILLVFIIYSLVTMTWILHYLLSSFKFSLPWATCDPEWAKQICNETNIGSRSYHLALNYWKHTITIAEGSDKIDDFSTLNVALTFSLIMTCMISTTFLLLEMTDMVKAMRITVILPFTALGILLVRVIFLEGASEGISHFFFPNLNALDRLETWTDAYGLFIYSMGVGTGMFISLGSYNQFKYDFVKSFRIIVLVDMVTSYIGAVISFSLLGFIARQDNQPLHDKSEHGFMMVFVVIASALARLPGSNFWCILYFFTLFTVSLNNQVIATKVFINAIEECFPEVFEGRQRPKFWLFVAVNLLFLLICLLFVTDSGHHYITVLHRYCNSGVIYLYVCLCENLSILWVYGIVNLYFQFKRMIRYVADLWFPIAWTYVTPYVNAAVIGNYFLIYLAEEYEREESSWIHWVGFYFGLSCILLVPIYALRMVIINFLDEKSVKMDSPSGSLSRETSEETADIRRHPLEFQEGLL